MMLAMYEEMARRIRIRSWKDVVLVLIATAVLFVLQWAMHRFLPNLSENVVKVVSYGVCIVIIVIGVFVIRE
ncbi:MAG: hypothetical protein IJ265_03625 [Oscillospiraceae bacterium]|nr:hypothetical protein [Oscillospiraceae bacterium]